MSRPIKQVMPKMLLMCLLWLPIHTIAQTSAPASKSSANASKKEEPKSSRAARREGRKQWWEQRRNERAEKKKVSDHAKKLQTKKVLKRMKKDRKIAERHTQNKRAPFYERWFKKS